MAGPSFDLQAHSTCSDGALPPREVVAQAAQAGVELLALSDHDTVDGVDEALEAGDRAGVKVVRAVEISSVQAEYEDLHILGYGIDHTDEHLRDQLREFRGDREVRAQRMQHALEELGWEIDESVFDARKASGKPIGRPHLSQAAFGHPANAKKIEEEGFANFSDLLVAYLIEDKPAYVGRTMPTVPQAVEAIHDAGGVAIWAHPFWDVDSPEEVLATLGRFVEHGMDGVEAFYATHSEEQTHLLCDFAAAKGLLTTGSTDFHSPDHERFNRLGGFELYGREPVLGPIGARSTPV